MRRADNDPPDGCIGDEHAGTDDDTGDLAVDSRDQGRAVRQEVLNSTEGIWERTLVGECTGVCPAHVDPAGAIQQANCPALSIGSKTVLMPWGKG